MDDLEQSLKSYLAHKPVLGGAGRFMPDEALWRRFFDNDLSEAESDMMSTYLASDADARAFALKTRGLIAAIPDSLPQAPKDWVAQAKRSVSTKGSSSAGKRSLFGLWYLLALGAFVLSFCWPRYYMQFLVVTVLAGMKGIMDQRQAKMQILIVKALESGQEINSERLKQFGLKK